MVIGIRGRVGDGAPPPGFLFEDAPLLARIDCVVQTTPMVARILLVLNRSAGTCQGGDTVAGLRSSEDAGYE